MLIELMETLDEYQYPDKIKIRKQRSEDGYFKGFWMECRRIGLEEELIISFDKTRNYTRIIGDITKAPKFKQGTHIQWDLAKST